MVTPGTNQLPLVYIGVWSGLGHSSGGERARGHGVSTRGGTDADFHQQCDVNYFEIRRAVGPSSVWSYEFHRRIDGRMPSPEGLRPYEMLPIPTDLETVHITLLVVIWTKFFRVLIKAARAHGISCLACTTQL